MFDACLLLYIKGEFLLRVKDLRHTFRQFFATFRQFFATFRQFFADFQTCENVWELLFSTDFWFPCPGPPHLFSFFADVSRRLQSLILWPYVQLLV